MTARIRTRHALSTAVLVGLLPLAAACSDDAETGPEKSVAEVDPAVSAKLAKADSTYREYLDSELDALVIATDKFTAAVENGDVQLSKDLFASSRWHWESIEPIAGLVPDIDTAIDARVDDFEDEEDPAWTGWHRIEHILWVENTADGAGEFAAQLSADVHDLHAKLRATEVDAADLAIGPAELIEEVSEGKITGEEDRYSHTDISDFAANVSGAAAAMNALRPALATADEALLDDIDAQMTEMQGMVGEYETAPGEYQLYTALTEDDIALLKAKLAALAETLAKVPGALGVS